MVVFTAAAALGASIIASGVGTAIGLGAIFTGTLGAAILGFGAQFALGFLMSALAPKPSAQTNNRGYDVNSFGSALDHQIIYGEVKTGGAVVYDNATGANNKFLHRIIAFAGHEVDSFQEIYLDDELLTIDVDGNVTSPERYDGKLRIKKHLGTNTQVADPDLVAEVVEWTSNHRLQGIAYLYIRMAFDADVFPNGVPVFTSVIRGKKIYDPRTLATAWSSNPALCVRDYLTSSTYGLGESSANIDNTYFSTAADVCDNLNYPTLTGGVKFSTNGAFTTAVTPYSFMNNIMSSMGGTIWYSQGKWRVKPAYYTTPVTDLTDDDLRSGISIQTRHSRRDNFNTVKGTFKGEETNWQVTDYPEYTNAAFVTEDNGQSSVIDLDLPFTSSSVQARRIARIALERNRQQLTVSASFGMKTFGLQVGDIITLTSARRGWSAKEFEIVSWNFGVAGENDLQVQLSLREISESVFDEVDDGVVYTRDNTTLVSAFDVPNVGLNAEARTKVYREKLTNIITLTVTSSRGESVEYVETDFKDSASDNWISLGTGQLGNFEAIDLDDGTYDFRARAINTFGIKGEWEFLFNMPASGLLAPPEDVSGFVAEVNGSVITLDWNPVPDLDLSYYRIRYSPDPLDATWANSINYVDKVSRPASSVSVPARAGTYLVRAVDKSGSSSVNYTTVTVPTADIEPRATTLSLTDSTTFTGTKTNTSVTSGTLRLTTFTTGPSTGDYLFSDYIETGDSTVKRCRVYISAKNNRVDTTAGLFDDQPSLFDSAEGLFDDLGGNSQFADTNVVTLVSTTQDDPAGSPTWSDYVPIKVADTSARAFRFKVILTSSSDNITPSISALTAYVEYN